ncbi:MAG: dienelactone hydrolase family protein [Gammaproteobacteria bacterium]
MTATNPELFRAVQIDLTRCLRAFERAQQDIRFENIAAAHDELRTEIGNTLGEIEHFAADQRGRDEHDASAREFQACTNLFREAVDLFLSADRWPEFGAAYMASRRRQCQSLERLYRGLRQWPHMAAYFSLDANHEDAGDGAGEHTGITHHERQQGRHDYSLYVPESYDASKAYPLVVALHGGYGRGDEYLWTWLRIARARRYILVAPKSVGPTWSIVQPPIDRNSIFAAMDEVSSRFNVDHEKVLLTGLSDGATFSFVVGLGAAERFTAMAPIAGVLSPNMDVLLRQKSAIDLPIHVVHGAHDTIFPVVTARSFTTLMSQIGYNLKYTELPDWGHALTYRINEQQVLPWFEQIING